MLDDSCPLITWRQLAGLAPEVLALRNALVSMDYCQKSLDAAIALDLTRSGFGDFFNNLSQALDDARNRVEARRWSLQQKMESFCVENATIGLNSVELDALERRLSGK